MILEKQLKYIFYKNQFGNILPMSYEYKFGLNYNKNDKNCEKGFS